MNASFSTHRYHRRLPAVWRWLGIGMRALHLAAVVLLGTAILGAPAYLPIAVVGVVVLATGLVLMALEAWKAPSTFVEFGGAAMLGKLVLVAWMIGDAAHAAPAFWLVTLVSVVFAHAPASARHRRVDTLWRRHQR